MKLHNALASKFSDLCGAAVRLKGPGHMHVACGVLLPARATGWLILKVHLGSSSVRMVPVLSQMVDQRK